MIRRGTTPTHSFTLPCDASLVKNLMIIYAQGDVEVFHKNMKDCKLVGNTASVTLTQEETLKLKPKRDVQMQLRILTNEGSSLVSDVETTAVRQVLNDEVLT